MILIPIPIFVSSIYKKKKKYIKDIFKKWNDYSKCLKFNQISEIFTISLISTTGKNNDLLLAIDGGDNSPS